MTDILDTAFAFLVFPGGLFPLALGLCLSFALIAAGLGLWDIASRYPARRERRSARRSGGQHD